MRRMVIVTRGSKRRPITRRDWRSGVRRRAQSKIWIGSRVVAARPLFLALGAQQMRRPRPSEWLGAVAMLLGVLSWGVLAALLAA